MFKIILLTAVLASAGTIIETRSQCERNMTNLKVECHEVQDTIHTDSLDLNNLHQPYRLVKDKQVAAAESLYRFVRNTMEETMGRNNLSDSLVFEVVEQAITDLKKGSK